MPTSPLSTNLRVALAERGLTQEQLARTIDVSNRSVAGWCLGETQPRWKQVEKLASALDRDPGWFYTDHTYDEKAPA